VRLQHLGYPGTTHSSGLPPAPALTREVTGIECGNRGGISAVLLIRAAQSHHPTEQ